MIEAYCRIQKKVGGIFVEIVLPALVTTLLVAFWIHESNDAKPASKTALSRSEQTVKISTAPKETFAQFPKDEESQYTDAPQDKAYPLSDPVHAETSIAQEQTEIISSNEKLSLNMAIKPEIAPLKRPNKSKKDLELLCADKLCIQLTPFENSGETDVVGVDGGNWTIKITQPLFQLYQEIQSSSGQGDLVLGKLILQLAQKGHQLGDEQQKLVHFKTKNITELESTFKQYQQKFYEFREADHQLEEYLVSHPNALADPFKKLIKASVANVVNIASSLVVNNLSIDSQGSNENKQMIFGFRMLPFHLIHQDANTICSGQSYRGCLRKEG